MIRYIDPEARYSDATIHHGIIHLGGQVPEDASADAAAQTRSVLAQTDTLLARCGSDKAHIVEATIFLANMADYAGMNAAWDAWVDAANPPARACVEAKLAKEEWLVEIKVSAVVKPTEAA